MFLKSAAMQLLGSTSPRSTRYFVVLGANHVFVFVLASGAATCTSVRVANAEGQLSGVYTLQGSNYIKRELGITYGVRYWFDDMWYVEQMYDGTSYPQYFVSAKKSIAPWGMTRLW